MRLTVPRCTTDTKKGRSGSTERPERRGRGSARGGCSAGAARRCGWGGALVASPAEQLAVLEGLVEAVQHRVLTLLGDRAGLDELVEVRLGRALDGGGDRRVVDVLVLGDVLERFAALELGLQ